MCFNWGALLGAASVVGAVDWHVYIPLYLGAACWTIVYDTSYARQVRISYFFRALRLMQ
jgi:4-hydroxybenzoate polyprenyltransferase